MRLLLVFAMFLVATQAAPTDNIVPEQDLDQSGYGTGKSPGTTCSKKSFIATVSKLSEAELMHAAKQAGIDQDLMSTGYGHMHSTKRCDCECTTTSFLATASKLSHTQLTKLLTAAGVQENDLMSTGYGHAHHPHKHAPTKGCSKTAFISSMQKLSRSQAMAVVKQAGVKEGDLVSTGYKSAHKSAHRGGSSGYGHHHHPHKHAPTKACPKTAFISTMQKLSPEELEAAVKHGHPKGQDLMSTGYGKKTCDCKKKKGAAVSLLQGLSPDEQKDVLKRAEDDQELMEQGYGPPKHSNHKHCKTAAMVSFIQNLSPEQKKHAIKKARAFVKEAQSKDNDLMETGYGHHRHHPHAHKPHKPSGCTKAALVSFMQGLSPTDLKAMHERLGF